MKCITEEAFIKCECERCKSHRDSMVSQAVHTLIFGIIRENINNILKENNEKTN